METCMKTLVRFACALLPFATGCADIDFSYVEDATLPPVEVSDIGSNCETDDPVDEANARVHVEQVGDECVITGAVKVMAVAYEDVVSFLDDIGVDPSEFSRYSPANPEGTSWWTGGICWGEAGPDAEGAANEKCDYGPTVDARWRPVGDDAWLPNPELPTQATAEIGVTYVVGEPATLDAAGDPGLVYTTDGGSFPNGEVTFDHVSFFHAFEDAFFAENDVWSLLQARVTCPMSDIATFTAHEYQITFAAQTFAGGNIEGYSLLGGLFEWLGGGGDDEAI
jgi:hypothetical protein